MQPEFTINHLAVLVCVVAAMPVGFPVVQSPVREGVGASYGV